MNRRTFLRFIGMAPVVPMVAVEVLSCPVETGERVNFPGTYIEGIIPPYSVGNWTECQENDPMSDMETAMKILERTNCNNPRHYVVSPGEWKILKDLELIK